MIFNYIYWFIVNIMNRKLDQFYTKPNVATECINQFIHVINPKHDDIIIEPSAGTGSFSNQLIKLFNNVKSYDLIPKCSNIIEQDYLDLTNPDKACVHVIGNPPFGRQSSLAKRFIRKSCEYAKSISFILPKSFKKRSFQQVFPKNFHLLYSQDIPPDSFCNNETDYDVPCVFQIWLKKDFDRVIEPTVEPIGYRYVTKTDNPDFSIRRVGFNAGSVDLNWMNKNIQSHYFIKLDYPERTSSFMNRYKAVIFEFNNTVGPRSISKFELNKEINKCLV